MKNIKFDVVIIGGGPAGITAGIYLSRAGKKVALLEGGVFGGQIAITPSVENYPGAGKISGIDLALRMLEDLSSTDALIIYENAKEINLNENIKTIKTDSYVLSAECVILAMGVRPRQVSEELENKFKGKGISYCATCDGPLYKNKTVAIIGGGKSAFAEALYLKDIAKTVYLIHRTDKFRAPEEDVLRAKNKGIIVMPFYVLNDCLGESNLQQIAIKNTQDASLKTLNVDALFISVGRVPNTELVAGKIDLDEFGFIKSEDGTTNIAGVYACGDIRTKGLRQIVTAVSDGAICATYAIKHLQ